MKIIAASCIALALAAGPAVAQSTLGANYNESLREINEAELSQAQATWLRGFYLMSQADNGPLIQDPDMSAILAARAHGHKTILSLKFNYHTKDFPAPGTPEMQVELARLDKVLPVVLGKVDILIIGNEPFIEAKPDQMDERLNIFYEALADHVIAYWKAHGGEATGTRLFMGAFNRLDLPVKRTAAVDRMLSYIASRPELSGIDLHPHMPSPDAVKTMVEYALPRIRKDQTFTVTEFSLVWLWRQHLNDPVPAEVVKTYNLPAGMKTYEFVDMALRAPVPRQEWVDFLNASPWIMDQAYFLRDSMAYFRSTGRLAVATYGVRQGWKPGKPFTAEAEPWIFNSLYASKTVQLNPDGTAQPGYPWLSDFVADQQAPGK